MRAGGRAGGRASAHTCLHAHACKCMVAHAHPCARTHTGTVGLVDGGSNGVVVTVATVVGTSGAAFSFDAPVLSYALLNMVATGGSSMTMIGVNFGSIVLSSTARLSEALCPTTAWSTSTVNHPPVVATY